MRTGSLLALLLIWASVAISAHIGRHDIERRQGWDIFGSAAEALGTFRSTAIFREVFEARG
jgi:hypothetical protein